MVMRPPPPGPPPVRDLPPMVVLMDSKLVPPTDSLARHPGRPWSSAGHDVSPFVLEYFASQGQPQLCRAVIKHYRRLLPHLTALINHHCQYGDGLLIVEGSAVLPELLARFRDDAVSGLWMTAPHATIVERIRVSANFDALPLASQLAVSAFTERAIAFDRWLSSQLLTGNSVRIMIQ